MLSGKPTYKRENVSGYLTVAPHNAKWHPSTYKDLLEHKNESPTVSTADVATVSQPTSGYQTAWFGGPGQKSMADIVKMGIPQNNSYHIHTTSNPSQQSINHNIVPQIRSEYDHVSPDNDWPITDLPQEESWLTSGQSNLSFDKTNELLDHETNEVDDDQDESSDEYQINDNHAGPTSVIEPFYDNDHYEHNEVEEIDASLLSLSANVQNLRVQEDEHVVQPEEDAPLLVIPNHLQVNTADCSHLSFGSFGGNMNLNTVFSRPSSVDPSDSRNLEYYDDGPRRSITGSENHELPSPSQTSVLKQVDLEVTRGSQSQYGFPSPANSHTFEVTRGSQSQISTPFLNDMATVDGNSVRESDLSFSQFSNSQPMPTRYASSASSISDPTISVAETLKNVGLSSSSQPPQQNFAGPQNLTMHHPYTQPTLPLGLFGNMINYPYLPQNYAYMPSGFQPTFNGNNAYHQQPTPMLPQYKNNLSVNNLSQSAAVTSGYGSFGNSTPIPRNYQVTQPAGPAGSTLSYDDVLNAHYKDNNHLLSLQQQQNESSPMWVHGGGSRTMPAVPASAYYNLQHGQNQQQPPTGFRQGQQTSQSYGRTVHNHPDFFQSQTRILQDRQLHQNPRDGGSQMQPKLQSQLLWRNGY